LNQIAGALEIPAKAIYDHRFSRWFFFEFIIFIKRPGNLTKLCTGHMSKHKKEKIGNMKIQVN